MQGFFAGLFALGIFIALAGGVIGLIEPSIFRFKMAETPSRKRVALISLAACIAAFVGVGVTAPGPTPEEKARMELAATKAGDEQKAKAELAAKEKMASENAMLAAAIDGIRVADRVCATSIIGVEKKTGAARDRYELYGVVRDAADNCIQASEDMSKLAVPKAIEEAHKLCVEGELTRALALGQGAAVLDAGSGSPSELQKIEDGIKEGQLKVLSCMGALVIAARKAGVPIGELK